MFNRGLTVPKSQEPDKTPFSVNWFHSVPKDKYAWPSKLKIWSMDVNVDNLAIRVENRDCLDSSVIIPETFDSIPLIKKGESREPIYIIVEEYVNKWLPVLNTCHIVICERPMVANYMITRITQHIITLLMSKLRDNDVRTVIIEIDSRMKTHKFGAPPFTRHALKNWTVEKTIDILLARRDYDSIGVMLGTTRRHDLADTIVQIEAFFILSGWCSTVVDLT